MALAIIIDSLKSLPHSYMIKLNFFLGHYDFLLNENSFV